MRDPSPRAPFDQGLFLTHLNRGKELYEAKSFEEAERELEEAYLLRPRDQKVLNLLGLVYFKQEKLERAEEVYRKLVAESPEANTLFYNLGLIYFKLSRFEEAESAFLKALELARDNPKINFYLGSIYERLHRFQDAIYQYRQAGANIMVRRVEDKIAASAQQPRPATAKKPEDTAEFKAGELQRLIRQRAESLSPPTKTLLPVSDRLMADTAPRLHVPETHRARGPEGTESTLPPGMLAPRFPEVISFPTRSEREPLRKGETFRSLENNLMEINFSGKVFIKQGSIYSYSGNLTFWVKEKRPEGAATLVIITGTGRLILTDRDRDIALMRVEGETVFVEPAHLLACEETLTPSYVGVGGRRSGDLEFVALEGQGMIALSVASKPLPLLVTPELPVSVPSSSVISWSGELTSHIVEDRQLYEVMIPAGRGGGPLIRLEGNGRILVEQALA